MILVNPPSQQVAKLGWSGSKIKVVLYFTQRTLQAAGGAGPTSNPLHSDWKDATYPFAPGAMPPELVSCPMSFHPLHPCSCWTGESHPVQSPSLCIVSYLSFPSITSDLPMLSSSSTLFIHICWYSCIPCCIIPPYVLIKMSSTALVPLI